jgi:hypothetical protein
MTVLYVFDFGFLILNFKKAGRKKSHPKVAWYNRAERD